MSWKQRLRHLWKTRYGFSVLLLIAFSSLLIRLLIEYRFDHSALLYVGVPFIISLWLAYSTPKNESVGWKMKYWRGMRTSLIVMLGSSIVLFEGFLCVAMFLPIYLFIVMIGFACEALNSRNRNNNNITLPVHLLPLIIFLSAFEGVIPELSQDRLNRVTQSRVVELSIDELKNNLIKPINLGDDMPWFLSLFPMPYQVTAESLGEGDIHKIDYRYHRWFFSNTHEGSVQLRIAEVTDNRVRTQVMSDSSYISNYLSLLGTSIEFEALSARETQVSLHIDYKRKLDPAWYFGPLQKLGIGQAASYLLDQVIIRNGNGIRGEHES